jgi:NTP pyrophosphatase (non-canonical NTP hydrolase)
MNEIQRRRAEFLTLRPLMQERDTPRHLIKQMRGEVDELEQELPPDGIEPNEQQLEKIGEELADVVIYAASLANEYGINIKDAALRKIKKDEGRFPAKLFQPNGKTFEEVYWERKTELGEVKVVKAVTDRVIFQQ